MIIEDDIRAAIERTNPQIATANSIADAFGSSETMSLREDLCATLGIDYDALMELGAEILATSIEEERAHAAEYTEGYVMGFVHAVGAARAEQARRGDV